MSKKPTTPKQNTSEKKGYTFAELMERYFPDDARLPLETVIDSIVSREEFFDILAKVSRPQPNPTTLGKSSLSE